MRAALCLALLVTAATPALAQGRYGPEPSALRAAPASATAGQRLLTWSNKVQPAAAPEAPAPQVQRTANLAAQPTPAPAENAPWRRLTGAPHVPQAASQAASQPMPQAVTQPTAARQAIQPAPARPAPQVLASNTPAPTRAPLSGAAPGIPDDRTDAAARATPAPQGEQARYYSLHRNYGETPDPIPIPQPTQVFLAAVPLSSLDQPDNQDADTGRTAAENKARITADWGAADDPSVNTTKRVQITRP